MPAFHLSLLPGLYAVCRLDAEEAVPAWAYGPGFSSITRSGSELSIVCLQARVSPAAQAERAWRALAVAGPLAFDLVGVVAGIAGALAAAGVALFVVSTFDTDYIFAKEQDLAAAVCALTEAGYAVDDTGQQ